MAPAEEPREAPAAGRPASKHLPPWLRIRLTQGRNYSDIKGLMRSQALHTVCEEARCPNIYDCWERRTATFLILGDICTRNCAFCAVKSGRPQGVDRAEPVRVAETVAAMELAHVVITSVDRDDLPDGGAGIFAETIAAIRARRPGCSIEVLTPDFQGDPAAIRTVAAARPEIFNHNIETVPRLYRRVRPKADYQRSLDLLRRVRELDPRIVTKSGLMVGLGETREELRAVFADLRRHGVEVLTVGQYLRPDPKHIAVERFYPPEEFAEMREEALAMGFLHVESGPLVRSSYHAAEQVPANRLHR
ncbi:MAG: lipoyl synthase [Firmicutes bacterium]|nr:lipoyl synthase [Bacillota bacterium]